MWPVRSPQAAVTLAAGSGLPRTGVRAKGLPVKRHRLFASGGSPRVRQPSSPHRKLLLGLCGGLLGRGPGRPSGWERGSPKLVAKGVSVRPERPSGALSAVHAGEAASGRRQTTDLRALFSRRLLGARPHQRDRAQSDTTEGAGTEAWGPGPGDAQSLALGKPEHFCLNRLEATRLRSAPRRPPGRPA